MAVQWTVLISKLSFVVCPTEGLRWGGDLTRTPTSSIRLFPRLWRRDCRRHAKVMCAFLPHLFCVLATPLV